MRSKQLSIFIKDIGEKELTQIIRNALADDVPFEGIRFEYGLTENDVVRLMKKNLPIQKFVKWRNRARGSKIKNSKKSKLLDML